MLSAKWCGAMVFAVLATASPALAQPAGSDTAITLTPAERTALLPLRQAVEAGNWTLATSLLPSARAAARTNDSRYVVARLQLDIAVATQNRAAQNDAISAVLVTRKPGAEEQVVLLQQYAGLAYDQGELNQAEGTLNRALQMAPNDAETLSMLAHLHRTRNNIPQSLAMYHRAVRAAAATGQPLPQSRYKSALAVAEDSGQRPIALEISRQLVAAYPSVDNWRDVLTVFRTLGTVDAGQGVDALRLMRAAGALSGERDYLAAATALDQAGLPAEAKSLLDEGIARRHLTATDSAVRALLTSTTTRSTRERGTLTAQLRDARAAAGTAAQARTAADALLSHGRHAEAAELYALALTRGGEDADLLNSRRGIALALGGNRAEAATAFAATTGARADIAGLWAIWAARAPA